MNRLKIVFPNDHAANAFRKWIIESGRNEFIRDGGSEFIILNRYDPVAYRRRIACDPQKWFRDCRRFRLKNRYGITEEQWDDLFESQERKCACCGSKQPGSVKGWHTDHDHDLDEIRGILCAKCNTTLGLLGDTIENVTESCGMYLDYLVKAAKSRCD